MYVITTEGVLTVQSWHIHHNATNKGFSYNAAMWNHDRGQHMPKKEEESKLDTKTGRGLLSKIESLSSQEDSLSAEDESLLAEGKRSLCNRGNPQLNEQEETVLKIVITFQKRCTGRVSLSFLNNGQWNSMCPAIILSSILCLNATT